MSKLKLSAKQRRVMRYVVRGALAVLLIGAGVVFLLAQRRPEWYVPVQVDGDELTDLRREVTNELDAISRKMVEGRAFTLRFSQDDLTRRLASMGDLWPELRTRWPAELRDPVVRIDEDGILVGGLFERGGWRGVVGVRLRVEVGGDDGAARAGASGAVRSDCDSRLRVRVVDATVGTLSPPGWLLGWMLDERLARVEISSRGGIAGAGVSREGPIDLSARSVAGGAAGGLTVEALLVGVEVENAFVWPNGRRRFRVQRIDTEAGVVTVEIAPD